MGDIILRSAELTVEAVGASGRDAREWWAASNAITERDSPGSCEET